MLNHWHLRSTTATILTITLYATKKKYFCFIPHHQNRRCEYTIVKTTKKHLAFLKCHTNQPISNKQTNKKNYFIFCVMTYTFSSMLTQWVQIEIMFFSPWFIYHFPCYSKRIISIAIQLIISWQHISHIRLFIRYEYCHIFCVHIYILSFIYKKPILFLWRKVILQVLIFRKLPQVLQIRIK